MRGKKFLTFVRTDDACHLEPFGRGKIIASKESRFRWAASGGKKIRKISPIRSK
jgi:hypothetical protein